MSIDTLTAVVCWLALVWAAARTNLHSYQARLPFLTFTCITLTATFRNPALALAIDRTFNLPDLGRVLAYFATTGTALFWAQFCLTLAPPESGVQRRRWLMRLTLPVLITLLLLWWQQIATGQPVQEYQYRTNDLSVAMTLVAQLYLFLTLIGIGMPTMIYSFEYEAVPALRLRLWLLAGSQVFAAMMTGSVTALYLLVLYDVLPRSFQSPIIPLLMMLTTLAYALALLPVQVFARLALVIGYIRHLWQLLRISQLERRTARLLKRSPNRLSVREVLTVPDYVLYTLMIAILDRRKLLFASPDPSARVVARRLEDICARAEQYPDLVEQFSAV